MAIHELPRKLKVFKKFNPSNHLADPCHTTFMRLVSCRCRNVECHPTRADATEASDGGIENARCYTYIVDADECSSLLETRPKIAISMDVFVPVRQVCSCMRANAYSLIVSDTVGTYACPDLHRNEETGEATEMTVQQT